ncbi:MAG: cytochrome c oxidase assembly protein [Granulosicoccaceae bacterium]|jgi:cytochrome c oxidase assembly protein subunit 11
MSERGLQQKNRRTVTKLSFVAVAMVGFGFALVPLYDLVCDITGLNGKTGRLEKEQALAAHRDESRLITIEFDANVSADLPWEFGAHKRRMQVHPGQIGEAVYFAQNRSDETITGQAIPSVVPSRAAKYFNKTECFCFTQQTFAGKEGRDMPLRFIVDPDLPKDIKTITLSYRFFKLNSGVQEGEHRAQKTALLGNTEK